MKPWKKLVPARASAVLIGVAAAAGVAATPIGGVASTVATPISASLPANVIAMPTLAHRDAADCVVISTTCNGFGQPMTWGGGAVQTSPAVYIVFWGWNGRDPSGEATYQQNFFSGVGGSAWAGTQAQYCESPSSVTGTTCPAGSGPHVGNPAGLLKGTWTDNTNPIPNGPDDNAIQAEAVRAAAHFANTTAASNASTQYIIDAPQGNAPNGFLTAGWCSYHGMASSPYGGLSYTNFPYMSDAGSSCGQNFVNSGNAGVLDGVSIVGGHEFAESITDPNPPAGWTDLAGYETGDKCAWIQTGPGASTNITLSTGSFAVQSLWSNTANAGAGGCATH